ncbi:non-ribosomal peptide synthetase [Pseudoxanthomonas dokdonensis]|uniref:non-ribosomal peptide synthetase n=1 Tax=Pseudoxanthomonas dokdonensis TaxID=344882 RepID=UPI00070E3779|nr:non-ribosomal peptide synthetase [Pseudoxanthomonas dokdonensis]
MSSSVVGDASGGQSAVHDPFAAGELARVVPTTEPQRELWLASQLGEDASLAYNESVSLVLRGRLDVTRLQAALHRVIERHDALRAVFGPDGETFCVLRERVLSLTLVDLGECDPAEQAAALQQQRSEGVDTAFNLLDGPLFRAQLLRLSDDEHVLLMHAHHIVCDGWSWWVLVRELGQLYAVESTLTDEPIDSFADYALSEALHPQDPQFRQDEAYWLSRFQGSTPVLELPLDRPRPKHRTFASRREDYWLPLELVSNVRRLGARQGASLFATLLAAFAGTLSRISGQDDVVIGIPAAGQSIEGHDRLVGHCVNLLPLRFDLGTAAGFSARVDEAHAILLDAIEHQRYTFGTLLKKLQVPRDPARLPLVSVMFNIDQALDQEKSGFPGLALDFSTNPRSHENFELSVNAVQVAGGLRLECQYNSDLFDQSTVVGWLSAFRQLLVAAVAQPDTDMTTLPLLDAQAARQLIALQPASSDYDRDCRMHEHFEWQCDRAPDRPAVRCGRQLLSYRQLEARANQIARLLRLHGIREGALVGLAVDRGVEMVAALLGILKAGAGYVPLDPEFPQDRLAYMAGDAGLATLLTQQRHAGRFDLRGRPVLALDTLQAELAALPEGRLGRDGDAAQPHSVAYVIYTSGSTGRPKGVQVPHAAVANFLASMQLAPGMQPDDRLLAVTTLSFDIAVLELMLPLRAGAEVIIATRDVAIDGVALAQCLQTTHVSHMQATPSTWRLLIEAGWRGHPQFTALCGGEPLPADLARQLLDRCGALWNLYGPTETTVWSTATQVRAAADGGLPDIHIGRPIANTRVWICDAQGRLCPQGVPGEICIAGDGVTLGYLNRPQLTADRFIAEPVSEVAGSPMPASTAPASLMYRTGDRGRWRSDGNLEHMGRLDFQVKIRGYRIEPGEIETQLLAHPHVSRAVVIVREDIPGDARLVAYVVMDAAGTVSGLADHLRRGLPDYMVPQHFVALDAIPLLPNGKTDRHALPSVTGMLVEAAMPVHTPTDALEQRIAEAMAAVLGRPAIDTTASFFQLGGHSLLAARLCARLTRELDIPVALKQLFETPSVAELAAALRSRLGGRADADAELAISHQQDQSQAPMTPMQRRLWLFEQMDPGTVTYNTPSAHRLRGPMDVQAFELAFQEMLRRQAVLRTRIANSDDDARQIVDEDTGASLLPLTDMSALPQERRLDAVMQELESLTAQPFDLQAGPLLRVRLYRLADDDHVLYFMTHHIIWDGWSFDIFYSEMSQLYQAFAAGEPSPLPELETSYVDYACWQQHRPASERSAQLDYWVRHLQGQDQSAPEPLHLPEDRPRPARQSGHGSTEWVHVDRTTTDQLHALSSQHGGTLFMTLLSAYYVLLHKLSGQTDLVVGLPYRNRGNEALEKIMGFFVNVLPLRMRLDTSLPFFDLVARIRDAVVEAFGYPDVPIDELIQALRVPRDPARSPIYQALFSFQDVRDRRTHWGHLEHEHLLMFQKGMSQDLGLWFLEHADGLSGAMGYNTDIIDEASAQRFHHRFVHLLKGIVATPQASLAELDICCQADIEQLRQWNQFDAAPAGDFVSLPALLQAQRQATPDATALRVAGVEYSYRQLHQRADQIAAALRGRGVNRGDRVGVCLDRNADMLASLIAVLNLGAAYVPLDPAYPADRLQFMVQDARLRLIISESRWSPALGCDREQLFLTDHDRAELHQVPARWVGMVAELGGEDPAYMIYTSGSTGKPKGVAIPQQAVVNFLRSMQARPGLAAGDRLLAVTTTSFDISVLELFLPLMVGASVVLADRESAMDGELLRALLASSAANVMQATPSTWRLLLDAGWKGQPGFKALCGGEPLPADLASQLLPRCAQLWNMYGPTETTVWSTCAPVVASTGEGSTLDIHIGTPIARTSVWVLDPHGKPCPPGVGGELHIGGDGVAIGYWQRPELTAQRFLPDPFAQVRPAVQTGLPARLYRTGDRGRWRMDGQLEHGGRLDHQVKVRGYRIELGEIETLLLQHEAINRAAVIVREDVAGDVRLVAYLAGPQRDAIDLDATMASLRRQLPGYMVPQHLLALDELPLLPNGKLDRNRLPAPQAAPMAAAAVASAVGPMVFADPRVHYLAQVWTEMLGVQARPEDNFFELGGHSMLAVQMANRVARDTGVRLRLLSLATSDLRQAAAMLPEKQLAADGRASEPPGLIGRWMSNVKRLLWR